MGEVSTDQDVRSKKVLDEVFGSDDSTWISITSHSGEIGSILRGKSYVILAFGMKQADSRVVLGHRTFSLSTGAVIPVLVKAETIQGTPASTASVPWTTISTCSTVPPLPTATS